jgi:hypothetical protein
MMRQILNISTGWFKTKFLIKTIKEIIDLSNSILKIFIFIKCTYHEFKQNRIVLFIKYYKFHLILGCYNGDYFVNYKFIFI